MIQDGYCICFNKWVLDTRIKNELPLLLIISSLTAKTGECFAGNKYFADLFNCTEVSVSQKINKLIELGYISAEYEKRGAEIKKRILRLKNFLTDDLNIFYPTIKKDFKDNNINIKNINNNIYIQQFEEFWKEYTPIKCDGRFIDKGSKKTAQDKFVKILQKGEKYEDIISGCKKYIEHCRRNNQLTCGVTVFLNQERWKNDYSGETCQSADDTKRQEPRSYLEIYSEIANELSQEDNIR